MMMLALFPARHMIGRPPDLAWGWPRGRSLPLPPPGLPPSSAVERFSWAKTSGRLAVRVVRDSCDRAGFGPPASLLHLLQKERPGRDTTSPTHPRRADGRGATTRRSPRTL